MRDAVLLVLCQMKDSEIKILDPKHKNYDKFVTVVKQMIDEGKDMRNGFSITFNKDYTKIRRDDVVVSKPRI